MHVLRAVEARGTTGSNAIGAEGRDGAFFEVFVGDEVVVVVGGEVGNGAAVGEAGFRAGGSGRMNISGRGGEGKDQGVPRDYGALLELCCFSLVGRGD